MTPRGLWTLCDGPGTQLVVEFDNVCQFLCGSLCVRWKTFEAKYHELEFIDILF